jgi:small subunit ribosomal protein S27Ae
MSEAKPKEEAKPREEAKTKEKKKRKGMGTLYDVNYEKGSIALKNRKCPRCGGIMAHHKGSTPRLTCGACSYTDFVKKQA